MRARTPIRLTPDEMGRAASVGVRRNVEAFREGRSPKRDLSLETSWQAHIIGAIGEMAVAKALGVEREAGVNTFKLPDVGAYQVRANAGHGSRMVVRPDDPLDDIYIHVTLYNGSAVVWGWIRGKDACRKEWWDDPGARGHPAWFVPHEALRPIEELMKEAK